MRNIFVEKSYAICGRETIPRPLSEKAKLHTSLDQKCKVLNSLFLLHTNFEGYQQRVKSSCRPLAFT